MQHSLSLLRCFSLALACTFHTSEIAAQSYETTSRCFFVYAAVVEVGRDRPHVGLFQYGQYRMNWFVAYLEVRQTDAAFKTIFDADLEQNKQLAEKSKAMIMQALSSGNRAEFDSAMQQSIECDSALGMPVDDAPDP